MRQFVFFRVATVSRLSICTIICQLCTFASTMAARAAGSRQQWSSPQPGFQCLASVRTDFDKDQCYVFELAHCPATGLVAAALSNRRIKLFNFK